MNSFMGILTIELLTRCSQLSLVVLSPLISYVFVYYLGPVLQLGPVYSRYVSTMRPFLSDHRKGQVGIQHSCCLFTF
jgi:hypothetical protein